MKKAKNSNWLLIGALMFFLISAGFTTIQEKQTNDPPYLCFICDAIESCKQAAGSQVGQANCLDFEGCSTWGAYCEPDDDPDDPEEEG